MKELPEVDAFIGTNEIGRILEAADETKLISKNCR